MKYTFLAIAACLFFTACNNETTTSETTEATEPATTTEEVVADPNAKMDPVCEMAKEDSWTEYTVEGTDTTWFCSSTCKEAYEGNPAKYHTKG